MKGYKATDKDMKCKGFQFALGKWHTHEGQLKMCESGFHFCVHPSGVWSFYDAPGTRVFEVEAEDCLDQRDGYGAEVKMLARKIKLVREITIPGSGNYNTGDRNTGNRNTGNRNTGDGNQGDFHSGSLNYGEAPIYLFNKITKVSRDDILWSLVARLSDLLQKDDAIDPSPFLLIPNASAEAIKKLHEAHINARKAIAEG